MAAASVRRPTAAEPRRNFAFPLFHRGTTPPADPSSPTNSIGSTGGLIYRDQRDAPQDLLNMMPNPLRDSSPGAGQPGQSNNPNNNNPYPRQTRIPPPSMGEGEHEPQPSGISPAGSLRRMTRENRGSSGSLNELGILPQDPTAAGANRPSSRDRERRDGQKNGALPGDKSEARKTSGNGPANGSGPIRPSPYSFDSTTTLKASNSTTDLLSFGNLRDSPVYDNSALASLDPLQAEGGSTGSMAKKQGSGDSLDLPNGEHGGWVSYDSADPAQRQEIRSAGWDQNKANGAFTASRFSPDRFPVLQERDDGDEEILSLPRTSREQPRPGHASQPSSGSPQQANQPRRRDLPIPGQQNIMPIHARDPNVPPPQPVIPVPKTQHAQVIQSNNWTRRPSSPLAREPVVAQNGSSEESDSYTPRSPHAVLPEIPSLPGSYVSGGSPQVPQQYQSSPTGSIQQNLYQQPQNPYQQPQNPKAMPPPALVNRGRPPQQQQQPMFEPHRGMPQMQLPMYTGASMATALSSISPSQSVSAVGSPHPQQRLPPGPPFGPSSSVFIAEQGRSGGKSGQMYPMLQQQAMNMKGRGNLNFSLDQQIAALSASQGYQALNSQNLAALKQLTERDLRAMGFGQGQPPQQQTPAPAQSARPTQNGSRRVVEQLDKAAGEVVELQDLQRAMGMNLEQWDNRDWQGHHRPVMTGNSAQYPSSHAVLPPGDRAKAKAAEEYERQLQQLNAMTANMGAYSSSSHMHQRPGNPIPPTPFSAAGPNGQDFPRVLQNGEGWIPVPNTDGYPPSYGELISLYEQHNPGKQPSMRDVLLMQLAALASEPENVEGSVFSKSETPFPPVGFNPFIQSQNAHHQTDSARSSPRDPPGEFDKMLRRVGTFTQPPRRAAASSIFGGDGETEVSRMAPSTATEGTMEDDGGDTTEDDKHSNETIGGGLRLNFDNSTTETLNNMNVNNGNNNMNGNMSAPSTSGTETGHTNMDLYPHLIGMLKSRAASVAPGFAQQMNSASTDSPWVEEIDSDEDLETELEVWGDEEGPTRLHPRFIRDESKRRRKWEIKFAELVKAFHELDRLTDTPMILLATPPRTSAQGAPVSHVAISRSIKRDRGYIQRAHDARQSYHNILTTPTTSHAGSYQSVSPPLSSPPLWGGPRLGGQGWSSTSAGSLSDADAQMRAQMVAALGSLKLMNKVEERREERRRQEAIRQKDEREAVERMLKALMSGAATSAAGSAGNAGSVSAGSPRNGSVRAESVGVPAAAEETTPPALAEND